LILRAPSTEEEVEERRFSAATGKKKKHFPSAEEPALSGVEWARA